MKFTLSWLKRFLDTDAPLVEITDKLTSIGLEVESIIDKTSHLQGFVVAHIIDAVQHPSADRLRICTVQTPVEKLQIVCGAANARAGIKVVLAQIGTTIPNGSFKIKESEIRGVKSQGMLCSSSELMLEDYDDNKDGIIELPQDAIIGEPFTNCFKGLCDPIIEINVTPNRGDALGVYGIARDLAATGIGVLKELKIETIQDKFASNLEIKIKDKNACPLFCIREIRNLKINKTPDWLKQLLENVGIRSISPIVDVTNYISLSFAQPMHAYKTQTSSVFEVKLLEKDTEFLALNNVNYLCKTGDLVISYEKEVDCLAGIIGGEDSACADDTTNIILEAACFNAKKIALTGRRLQIDTDSRRRFERNVDQGFVLNALNIATHMILSICGGEAGEVIVLGELSCEPKTIEFSISFFNQYSGVELSSDKIIEILKKLGFKILDNSILAVLKLEIPSWRHDISIREDIVEEVLRIHGYDNIVSSALPTIPYSYTISKSEQHTQELRRMLAAAGYNELITWSFIHSKTSMLFSELNDKLKLVNPISAELDYMRPSLIPNLLDAIAKNSARSIKNMSFFEIGQVFSGTNPEEEKQYISGVRCGSHYSKNCHTTQRAVDSYDIKADLSMILNHLEFPIERYKTCEIVPPYYHPTRALTLKLGQNIVAYFGQIHPKILRYFGIDFDVLSFELCLENVPKAKAKFAKRTEFNLSNFQVNRRDYAFVIDIAQPVGTILAYIKNIDKKLIKNVDLFDIYINDKIGVDKKSIAISIDIQAEDRTLTEEELVNIDKIIIKNIKDNFNGEIRTI